MKYSIIVPTYNRKYLTLAVVGSMLHFFKKRDDFEIIVVDDGSTDKTDKLFLSLTEFSSRLVVVQTDKALGVSRNPGFARNAGAKNASGEILCFCDGDIIHLLDPLKSIDELISDSLNLDEVYFTGIHYRLFEKKLEGPRGVHSDMPHGSWLAVSKKVFFELGGYDERFKVYGNEDQDIVQRLRRKGLKHIVLENNIAIHPYFEADRDSELELTSIKNLQMEYQRDTTINRNNNIDWGKGEIINYHNRSKTDTDLISLNGSTDINQVNNIINDQEVYLKLQALDHGITALIEQGKINSRIFNFVNNINQVVVSSSSNHFQPKPLHSGAKQVFEFLEVKSDYSIYSDLDSYPGNTSILKKDIDIVVLSKVHRERNVGMYLDKAFDSLKINGQLVVLCPYYSNCVGSGNVNSLWNAGYLIYSLILAGFDCKNAKLSTFKNEIQVYLRKSPRVIPENKSLGALVDFFPFDVYQHYNGNVLEVNWL